MSTNEAERDVVLHRDMPFERELIWQAITSPEHMPRWWGPDGFTIEDLSMDLRVGGSWSFVMVGPDGTRYPNLMEFTEITPPCRLVFDHGDGERVWFKGSVILETRGSGTRVTIRHLFPTKESRDEVVEKYGAIEGGKQHLAKMEAYVREHLA